MTLKDVALLSGCSVATVSKVFKNSIEISDATKDRVLKAAKDCGYLQKATTRTAVLGGMKTLLVATNDKDDITVLYTAVTRKGFTPLFCKLTEAKALQLAAQIGAMGVVVCGATAKNNTVFAYHNNADELQAYLTKLLGQKTARAPRGKQGITARSKAKPDAERVEQPTPPKMKQEEIWLL